MRATNPNSILTTPNGLGNAVMQINGLSLSFGKKTVFEDLNWTVNRGEVWVLAGESGSGKTMLAQIIAGQRKAMGRVELSFDEHADLPARELLVASWYQFTNLEGDRNFYYQQRYNKQQRRETLTAEAELAKFGVEHQLNWLDVEPILKALSFTEQADAQLFELSSGEHKKLQLIKALWLKPQLIIIDQPYTGLDAFSRQHLNQLIDKINQAGSTLILITNEEDLPACSTHFATIKNHRLVADDKRQNHPANMPELKPLPSFLGEKPKYTTPNIINLKKVSVRYGDKPVLNDINWEVKAGERWLVQGHNGSGKSTLLSLITADHPQAYAHDVYLFGKKRGEGESIWDIKKRIGLISPEFHWYFDTAATVYESIASGLFDSNGLYQNLRYAEKQKINELLVFFGLEHIKDQRLSTLPLGKQRLALLARTVIKNPELLVLDEPCQGLDQQQTRYFNQFVDELSSNGMTIIYVGHFETQLPSCIDHRLIMEKGKINIKEKINTVLKEII